jgi:O-acetyl-ADP-ribose deacetylase (regulator of RNase III)
VYNETRNSFQAEKVWQEMMSENKPSPENNLDLDEYKTLIKLEEPFISPTPAPEDEGSRTEMVERLITYLQAEVNNPEAGSFPASYQEKRRLLKALLTVREPDPLPEWFTPLFDQILQYEMARRPVVSIADLPTVAESFPGTSYQSAENAVLWQGDITNLKADAIVNAANAQLLGCMQPFHACIDNVIHSAAGPQVREDCHKIIERQGNPECTGWAKITRGYNLPAKFILHTVGPIVPRGEVTTLHEEQLSNCYTACLDGASRISGIRSVAFCSISTGVFGYPKILAAEAALKTVDDWLQDHPDTIEQVVFNVFLDEDLQIYEEILEG